MQEKIYRNSLIFTTIQVVSLVSAIVLLLVLKGEYVKEHVILIFALFIFIFLVSFYLIRYYEYHKDKDFIIKALDNKEIALFKINNGAYYKSVKDSLQKKYNLWKLEGIMYDTSLNANKVVVIDKFNIAQTSIPMGYCYITNKDNEYLVIPNQLISAYIDLKDDVENYEKHLKNIRYLNVYYSNGLKMETYKESLKKKEE